MKTNEPVSYVELQDTQKAEMYEAWLKIALEQYGGEKELALWMMDNADLGQLDEFEHRFLRGYIARSTILKKDKVKLRTERQKEYARRDAIIRYSYREMRDSHDLDQLEAISSLMDNFKLEESTIREILYGEK